MLFPPYINGSPDNVICNIAHYNADVTTVCFKFGQASDLCLQPELVSELETQIESFKKTGLTFSLKHFCGSCMFSSAKGVTKNKASLDLLFKVPFYRRLLFTL